MPWMIFAVHLTAPTTEQSQKPFALELAKESFAE